MLKVTGGSEMPKEFALSQNYPNPFNPTTHIKYALPVDSRLAMEIYNVIGQRVRTLVNGDQAAGYHIAEWNGTNNAGAQLASGMYLLRMSATGIDGKKFNDIRKLMLLK
jgi:flagellar hook assembly protein FlgD